MLRTNTRTPFNKNNRLVLIRPHLNLNASSISLVHMHQESPTCQATCTRSEEVLRGSDLSACALQSCSMRAMWYGLVIMATGITKSRADGVFIKEFKLIKESTALLRSQYTIVLHCSHVSIWWGNQTQPFNSVNSALSHSFSCIQALQPVIHANRLLNHHFSFSSTFPLVCSDGSVCFLSSGLSTKALLRLKTYHHAGE